MTKEPKLVRARQIPEWDTYDRDIAAFAKRIEGQTGKGMAASVDALAGNKEASKASHAETAEHPVEPAMGEGNARIEDEL